MEKLTNTPFTSLPIPENSKIEVVGEVLKVTKWNWDFLECLNFQKAAQEVVRKNKKLKIYIFCNHPPCFTLGRGNERGQENLIDFNPELAKILKFPIHKIHRGGGITYHYPGQWIFYPIVAINQNYSLDDHMCWLLKSVTEILKEDFGITKAMTAKKLMGIWVERKKIASIGVGVNRFVTEHGLALNLIFDENVFSEVAKINPCGMNSGVYICADQIIGVNKNFIENFHKKYLDKMRDE